MLPVEDAGARAGDRASAIPTHGRSRPAHRHRLVAVDGQRLRACRRMSSASTLCSVMSRPKRRSAAASLHLGRAVAAASSVSFVSARRSIDRDPRISDVRNRTRSLRQLRVLRRAFRLPKQRTDQTGNGGPVRSARAAAMWREALTSPPWFSGRSAARGRPGRPRGPSAGARSVTARIEKYLADGSRAARGRWGSRLLSRRVRRSVRMRIRSGKPRSGAD